MVGAGSLFCRLFFFSVGERKGTESGVGASDQVLGDREQATVIWAWVLSSASRLANQRL